VSVSRLIETREEKSYDDGIVMMMIDYISALLHTLAARAK